MVWYYLQKMPKVTMFFFWTWYHGTTMVKEYHSILKYTMEQKCMYCSILIYSKVQRIIPWYHHGIHPKNMVLPWYFFYLFFYKWWNHVIALTKLVLNSIMVHLLWCFGHGTTMGRGSTLKYTMVLKFLYYDILYEGISKNTIVLPWYISKNTVEPWYVLVLLM